MPTCDYTIRRDSPDGPQIRFAKVGDKVFHRWQCTTDMVDMFGMLINSCFVDDGAGQRVQVVDERGCSVDQFVLPVITYQRDLLAYVEAAVFKFADRPVLDFQCAITICIRSDGGCDGVTVSLFGISNRPITAATLSALDIRLSHSETACDCQRYGESNVDNGRRRHELVAFVSTAIDSDRFGR